MLTICWLLSASGETVFKKPINTGFGVQDPITFEPIVFKFFSDFQSPIIKVKPSLFELFQDNSLLV